MKSKIPKTCQEKQYCFVTTFKGIIVYRNRRNYTYTFRIVKDKRGE